jgi:hypothetical protein
LASIRLEAFAQAGVAFAEGILEDQVGVGDAVQLEVHGADADHGAVELNAGKHPVVVMVAEFLVVKPFGMVFVDVFTHAATRKPAVPHGRIADDIVLFGLTMSPSSDDVPGGAELSVITGRGNLAEHVFVEVALGVAVLHLYLVHHLHHLVEQPGVCQS